MRNFLLKIGFPILVISLLSACGDGEKKLPKLQSNQNLNSYWNNGKAEVNHYELQQERYGQLWEGEAQLIFVKEDFDWFKQVKMDHPNEEAVPVIKLNSLRYFDTQNYPYRTMTSVFHPLDETKKTSARKISFSSQEWCGQVYSQMNQAAMEWFIGGHSYFEKEGDQQIHLGKKLTEDELFIKVRLNPAAIKTGKVSIIPSLLYSRLNHKELRVYDAEIKITKNDSVNTLLLNYSSLDRWIKINYEAGFPHQIQSWEEGSASSKHSTKAILKKSERSAYWEF